MSAVEVRLLQKSFCNDQHKFPGLGEVSGAVSRHQHVTGSIGQPAGVSGLKIAAKREGGQVAARLRFRQRRNMSEYARTL
jgi:hypothetical protein